MVNYGKSIKWQNIQLWQGTSILTNTWYVIFFFLMKGTNHITYEKVHLGDIISRWLSLGSGNPARST